MRAKLIKADARQIPLEDGTVQTVVTSPPYYGLRDYGTAEWIGGDAECDHKADKRISDKSTLAGYTSENIKLRNDGTPFKHTCGKCGAVRKDAQLGLEPTLAEYIENMVAVFDEVWRVLRDDGTVWLNIGDSYNGSAPNRSGNNGYNDGRMNRDKRYSPGGTEGMKPKDLMMVPHRLAIALQDRGWWVRSDIEWHKPNPMPESVTDRPTKAHEYIFLLSKSKQYYYDADAVREDSNGTWEIDSAWRKQRVAASGGALSGGTGNGTGTHTGRNRRSVWTITTKPYSGAHFATFPPEIPEICIKAGTSEKGQCPECGAPWVRVVSETGRKYNDHFVLGKAAVTQTGGKKTSTLNGKPAERTTTGWQPTCSHDLEPVPQIVLDPFAGSGTTVMVAQALGRVGIGLDISDEYLELARERCNLKALDEWQNGKKAEANLEGLPMFGGE